MKVENSIVNIKPDKTHLIKLNNYTYQKLIEVGFDPICGQMEPEETIGFLIYYYHVMRNGQKKWVELEKQLLFGNTIKKKELIRHGS